MTLQILRTYQVQNAGGTNVDTLLATAAGSNISVNSGATTLTGQTGIVFVNTISSNIVVTTGTNGNANVSVNNIVRLIVPLSDTVSPLVAGANIAYVHAPRAFTITGARASLLANGNSGPVTGQTNCQVTIGGLNLFTAAALLTVDNHAVTSIGSAITPSLSNTTVADDAIIKYSILNAGGNAIGLIVTLFGI